MPTPDAPPGERKVRSHADEEEPRRRGMASPDPAEARALGTVPGGHPASAEPGGFRGAPASRGDLTCVVCGTEFHKAQDHQDHQAAAHAGMGP
jgi:hypothetical protein